MKAILFATLLLAGSAMAQQQDFRYLCSPSNMSMTVAVSSLTGGGSCNTNIPTPNVSNDYPNVLTSVFDSTTVIGDGHITNLRVQANAFTGGGGGGSVLVTCGDDNDAIRVHDGDRVGAYYTTTTGVLTIYINTTASTLQCSVPIVFPGTVASEIQVEFFKK